MKQIVGVLHFNSKFKYGTNAKRAEYFLFKPLSKKHEPHLVASSKKEKLNQYAIISFLRWDKDKSKLPYGQLHRIIGPCADLHNTYDAIIYKHHLTTASPKCALAPKAGDNAPGRRDVNTHVFSVDPVGCQDIDDALSASESGEDGTTVVGIHIADVSAYFDMYDIQIKNYSTIYAPHRIYNMIPDKFAQRFCSLQPGERRFAFSVFVQIGPSGQVLESWFEKTTVQSSKAYNYDELQHLIDAGAASQSELKLYELGRQLSPGAVDYDTHKMVENYMVLANRLVGKFLFEHAPPNRTIFRVHEAKQPAATATTLPSDILTLLESNAALYTSKSASDYYHSGLGIEHYTHFTSPIRRYVDVYIHRLLHAVMLGMPDSVALPDVESINEYERNVKRAQREFNKIKLATLMGDNGMELDATIVDLNEEAVCVYFSAFNVSHLFWVKLIDKRLRHLATIERQDSCVSITTNKGVVALQRFQTIRIQLQSTLYNDEIHRKIAISIPIIECITTRR